MPGGPTPWQELRSTASPHPSSPRAPPVPAGGSYSATSPRRRPRGHTFGPATRTGAAATLIMKMIKTLRPLRKGLHRSGNHTVQTPFKTLLASTGAPGILAGRGSRFAPRPAQGRQDDPTSCSTGQASLASHPISSGCPLDIRLETWTERESCDSGDGKLRQQCLDFAGEASTNY